MCGGQRVRNCRRGTIVGSIWMWRNTQPTVFVNGWLSVLAMDKNLCLIFGTLSVQECSGILGLSEWWTLCILGFFNKKCIFRKGGSTDGSCSLGWAFDWFLFFFLLFNYKNIYTEVDCLILMKISYRTKTDYSAFYPLWRVRWLKLYCQSNRLVDIP